ncbi:MAG: VanZ family protein [Gemmataceae bacterium]|nr:VanZ family protein [Gemmataceae bacterium]
MNSRWLVWLLFFAAWTVALTAPVPSAEELPLGELLVTRRVLVAKAVHIAAYALFAILTGWLRVASRWRPLLMFFLMLHAVATEFVQLHLSYRTGTLGDVLFDCLGIAVGCGLSWPWWLREDSRLPG